MRDITIPAVDGYPLAATLFKTGGAGPVAIVSSATAVPRAFYRDFAADLAQRGASAVVTYDYRGIAGSRPRSLRGFGARMRDWAFLDFNGVITWAGSELGGPLVGIGHSFGGQALGLIDPPDAFRRYAAVATISGYFGHLGNPVAMWAKINLVGLPLTHMVGYAPTSWFGMGLDLPKRVYLEWSKWCRSRNYFFDDPTMAAEDRYLRYDRPLLSVRMADDPWGTERATESLIGRYRSAEIERLVLTPDHAGGAPIGHLGFFRARHKQTLWPLVAQWLLAG